MSQLQLEDLHKAFGVVEALNGVSFAVEDGAFYALLGPSAAGKTTTLRAIAGLERVDRGRVLFEGADLTEAPVQGRPMAMIFQTFALYPHLSVRGNLSYGLRESGARGSDVTRRVDEVAEMLRVSHTLERLPSTLSGGEQQRVAIGRALVRRPRLLLLDEPLTNLDAKLRHDTRAEFKRLHRELGMTMLYATPDQLEALSMADTIAVLDQGRILQIGSPDDLYDRPDDRAVANLVGAPAINLLPARRTAEGGVALDFIELADGPWRAALAPFAAGTELLFGFRPQDVRPGDRTGEAAGPRFGAHVHLTEPLGDITILDLVSRDQAFKMVLPEEQALAFRPGDALEVELRLEHTHLFARDTGTAIR